jgi:glyoxylase-like metal-dependent hydrolase (beta-lactamase superfamily II)
MRNGGMRVAMALAVSCAIGLGVTLSVGSLSAAPAPALNPAQTRVEDAYAAMGWANRGFGEGAQARETLLIMTTKGSMKQWDPGQSQSVSNLAVPDWGTATFTQVWDRSRGATRTEWVRPRAGGGTRNYTEILSETGGYVIGSDVNGAQPSRVVQTTGNNPQPLKTMSGLRARALLREVERNGIVFFMHDRLQRVSDYPSQTVGGKTYPAVQFRGDNGTFVVMFDSQTKLPAIVRTRDFDQFEGDSNFDATYSDWRDVNGVKFPHRITYTLNGQNILDTTINSITFNTQIAADSFNVPAAVRGKAPPPAALNKTPYQWVIRRLATGFYLDSDAQYADDGKSLQLVDIAPNISHVTGGSHHTLIVATNDYLVAFDAPGDDGLSQWVINAAAQKYPGKKFRYVVLTHHHIDHSGGVRAYAAEGATIVVGRGNGAFYRRVLAAPAGTNPYRLATFTPRVVEVGDKWSVNDGGRVIEAYSLETPHATGYLIPFVPDARLAWVTDLWNPGAPIPAMPNPAMVSIVRGVEKSGFQPERFAGGHGSVAPYADLAQAVQRAGGG